MYLSFCYVSHENLGVFIRVSKHLQKHMILSATHLTNKVRICFSIVIPTHSTSPPIRCSIGCKSYKSHCHQICIILSSAKASLSGGEIKLADKKKKCIQQSRTSRNHTHSSTEVLGFIIQVMQAISHFICPFPFFLFFDDKLQSRALTWHIVFFSP